MRGRGKVSSLVAPESVLGLDHFHVGPRKHRSGTVPEVDLEHAHLGLGLQSHQFRWQAGHLPQAAEIRLPDHPDLRAYFQPGGIALLDGLRTAHLFETRCDDFRSKHAGPDLRRAADRYLPSLAPLQELEGP